jgi:hypothetical protein
MYVLSSALHAFMFDDTACLLVLQRSMIDVLVDEERPSHSVTDAKTRSRSRSSQPVKAPAVTRSASKPVSSRHRHEPHTTRVPSNTRAIVATSTDETSVVSYQPHARSRSHSRSRSRSRSLTRTRHRIHRRKHSDAGDSTVTMDTVQQAQRDVNKIMHAIRLEEVRMSPI